jgi:hypothetical protein
MSAQIQKEIDKLLLSPRYYTYILVSIIFADNMRKCHHMMVDVLRYRSGWLEDMGLYCAVYWQMGVTASLLAVLSYTVKGQF